MLISHRKNFIYTKTVKTAGTSVESYFETYCLPEGMWEFAHQREEYVSDTGIIGYRGSNINMKGKKWYGHMPARRIRNQVGSDIWAKYFKFCVIRNPFDKTISVFHYRQNKKERKSNIWKNTRLFSKKRTNDKDLIKKFRKNVKKMLLRDRNKYVINGEVCVDYFIRYESLAEGIRHVCQVLDIVFEPENIPRLKSGIRPPHLEIAEYYDAETIEIVSEHYAFELGYFGYKPPI